MHQLHAHTPHAPYAHQTMAPFELRVAPLVAQRRRRDGALEFVATLTVLCILVAASVAYVRGTPVVQAKPPVSAAAGAAAVH